MVFSKLLTKKMTTDAQRELVDKVGRFVSSRAPLCRSYIFGSLGQMSMSDVSDVDLLIIVPPGVTIKETRIDLRDLPLHIQRPVDLIILTEDEFEAQHSKGGIARVASTEGINLNSRAAHE